MRVPDPLLPDCFPQGTIRFVDPEVDYTPKENEEVSCLFYGDERILQMVSIREKEAPYDPFSGQKTR